MTPVEFKSRIANAIDLDFGTIFSQSIELYKKSWLQGFLLQLILMVLVLPIFLVIYVPIIMVIVSQSQSGNFDPDSIDGLFGGLSVVYGIVLIVAILAIAVIQMMLVAAFYKMLRNLDEGREVKTSELFYFMKGKYIGKLLLLMLVTLLIAIPAILLFYLPIFYLMVPISFFTIIFAFNPEWSISDIVGSGFQLGNKKWFLTFGLLFVSYLAIVILTFVTCGLGSLFLTPFLYHPIYYIYKGTVGFDDFTELNQIGEGDRF